MKELRVEYFIVSAYLLLRHLLAHYVFTETERELFRRFLLDFHGRWDNRREEVLDVLRFADARQQNGNEIDVRHRILRQIFFEFATENDQRILDKDERRAFNEAERIAIYRRDDGLCAMCLEEGKPEAEAMVLWREFDADHVIPHSRGGPTAIDNGRVLCRVHNRGRPARGLAQLRRKRLRPVRVDRFELLRGHLQRARLFGRRADDVPELVGPGVVEDLAHRLGLDQDRVQRSELSRSPSIRIRPSPSSSR